MKLSTFANIPPPIAGNGDVNGDGFSDVIVGGPRENEGRGCVVAFYGGPGGLREVPDWTFNGQRTHDGLGISVAMADFNGDGISDLVVTEMRSDSTGPDDRVAMYLFCGSSNGLPASPTQTFPAKLGRFNVRFLVAAAGDVNGDGYADLAIAAEELTPTGVPDASLALLIFHGSPEGLHSAPDCVIYSEQAGSCFGITFGCAGDVNGDGFDDFFASAMKYTGRYKSGGKAYLFLGSPKGLRPEPDWTLEYPLPVDPRTDGDGHQFFGCGMGPAGDVNGDGFDDVVIGAWFASHGEISEGAAFVYLGSARGLGKVPAWQVESNHTQVHLGQGVTAGPPVTSTVMVTMTWWLGFPTLNTARRMKAWPWSSTARKRD